MKTASTIVEMVIRLAWTVLMILGVLFWTGRSLSLVPLHMKIGSVFVISLWILGFLALISGAKRGLAVFLLLWGAVVLYLGIVQTRLMPGGNHWVIQVTHILLSMAAIGMAETLAATIKRNATPKGEL